MKRLTLTERLDASPMMRNEIAAELGVHRQTLRMWERGKLIVKIDNITALAVVLKCKASDLNPELRGIA